MNGLANADQTEILLITKRHRWLAVSGTVYGGAASFTFLELQRRVSHG